MQLRFTSVKKKKKKGCATEKQQQTTFIKWLGFLRQPLTTNTPAIIKAKRKKPSDSLRQLALLKNVDLPTELFPPLTPRQSNATVCCDDKSHSNLSGGGGRLVSFSPRACESRT